MFERHDTDILILGSGGAGLFAALHAGQANPGLRIALAVKGLCLLLSQATLYLPH